MRTRAWRFVLLIVLLASGAGAALSGWTTSHQIAELERSQRELGDRVDRLLTTLDAVTTAQQANVATSPESEPAPVSRLIEQIGSETDGLRPHVRSIDAGRALQAVTASVATIHDIEARAQEHLRLGQALMAADLLFSDGRSADKAVASGLRTLRVAENDAYAAARADALDSLWTIVGAVGVLWVLGLILLTRQSTVVAREESSATGPAHTLLALGDARQEPAPATPLDLQPAADVCTAIGQLTSAEDLPRLLQQAASVLDASGVVVWMAAGEDLFAAAAFGYPPHVIRKLGPINRAAVNATAAAWRTGILQVVSGDRNERSALAAPMLGPERCIGVLAVEVGVAQEVDAAKRAVTTLIAAQLTAALAGWPAASAAAAPVQVPPLDRAAEA
jgi:hypothetical protein